MQREFLKYLRFERSLLACDEVSSYGCIADVLAVDKNKKHVLEYEFKCSSQDLKINEKQKDKYQQQYRYFHGRRTKTTYKQPHRFYYVVPKDLYEKEKVYLEAQGCGIIMYSHCPDDKFRNHQFLTMKPCKLRKKDLQKYDVAARDILRRATSAYVNLLLGMEQIKLLHSKQLQEAKEAT